MTKKRRLSPPFKLDTISWKAYCFSALFVVVLVLGVVYLQLYHIPSLMMVKIRADMQSNISYIINLEPDDPSIETVTGVPYDGHIIVCKKVNDSIEVVYFGLPEEEKYGREIADQVCEDNEYNTLPTCDYDSSVEFVNSIFRYVNEIMGNCIEWESLPTKQPYTGALLLHPEKRFNYVSESPLQFYEFRAHHVNKLETYRMLLTSKVYDNDSGILIYRKMKIATEILIAVLFIQTTLLAYWFSHSRRRIFEVIDNITGTAGKSGGLDAHNYPRQYRELVNTINRRSARQDARRAYLIEQTLRISKDIRHEWDNYTVNSWKEMNKDDLIIQLHAARHRLYDAAREMVRISAGVIAERELNSRVGEVLDEMESQVGIIGEGNVELEICCRNDASKAETRQPYFRNIIRELAINATKYSISDVRNRERKIRLLARLADGTIEIEVHNTGKRFPKDANERGELLDIGRRGKWAEVKEIPGTGLGLAAVREWLTMGGGEIELGDSDVLGGACVTVWVVAS